MIAKILLTFTIFFAFFLRIYQLNLLPPSLNWDEISLGYSAYSILKTGKDEWGSFLPLSFRAYGDYKLPAYVYLDVPSVAVFGLNEWGVRLPSAIMGVGFVILIFLILKKLSNIHVASWGVLLSAIIPWTFILSRIALEANLALFLTTLGFYFFLMGLKNSKFLIFSSLAFGLTIFSYNSSRVVTPLLILSLGLFYWKELINYKKSILISIIIFITFFLVALPNALLQDSSARYRWTAILDEGAINRINELRGSSALPPTIAEISYNKVTYLIPEVAKNYASHFNPNFLFLSGGSNFQYSVPGFGMLYSLLAPFLLIGFWHIFKERQIWQLFFLSWFLISPIPAAITRDAPHALRSLLIIPPLIIICSVGLDVFITWFPKWKLFVKGMIVAGLMLSLIYFWKNYSVDYTNNYSWSWQYGYKEAVDFIKNNGDNYQKIYFTKKYGEPHEFLLFYLKYDPEKYINDPRLIRYFRSDWYWVDSFDKFVFLNDWEIKDKVKSKKEKSLLITSSGNYPEGSEVLETINFLDGRPAFDIVELARVQ